MRALFEVGLIALASSWKWLLGVLVAVGAIIGILFAVGVIGGGDSGQDTGVLAPTPTPRPTARPTPTPKPTPKPTLVPTVAPTDVPSIRIVEVQLMATGAESVGSIEFVLVYDPSELELTDVSLAGLAGNALMETITLAPGRLWAGIIDSGGITGDGALVAVNFNLLDDAEGDLSLSLEEVLAYDSETLVDIITDTTPGRVSATTLAVEPPVFSFR